MALLFKPIGSGSKGNCYVLHDGYKLIMLECGMPLKELRKAGYPPSHFDYCLITHGHKDHAKYLDELNRLGVTTIGPLEECEKQPVLGNVFEAHKWLILPVFGYHDINNIIYLLVHRTGKYKCLFATDTCFIKQKFSGLTHIFIECNFDQETLDRNLLDGKIHPQLRERIIKNHFGLEQVLDFLDANDLRSLQEIWLLHMSHTNANPDLCIQKVKEKLPKFTKVRIA